MSLRRLKWVSSFFATSLIRRCYHNSNFEERKCENFVEDKNVVFSKYMTVKVTHALTWKSARKQRMQHHLYKGDQLNIKQPHDPSTMLW